MTIGSVYDPGRGCYRYYRLPRTPGEPWSQPGSTIGTGVEDALPSLPLGSVEVGQGSLPIGMVLNPGEYFRPYVKYAAIGVGALILWRVLRTPRS